jgi:membrane protein implicated in regulation of membrane protease activity
MLHQGWVWVVAGLVLGIAETILPGFILLGFGIGAVVTGLLIWGGVMAFASLPVMFLVFALASLVAWVVLKRVFGLPGQRTKIWHRDINDN